MRVAHSGGGGGGGGVCTLADMYASGMRKLSSSELECLSHLRVRCDNYVSSLSGC